MDYGLAKEIYMSPWYADISSIKVLTETLEFYRNNQIVETKTKSNEFANP